DRVELVGVGDGGQPVGDDDGGASGAEAVEGVGDAGLAGRVQVAGGLVQDQQGRVGDPGPGEGDQLALPGGQQGAPLTDLGVEAVGQAGDDLVGPDGPSGGLDLGPGRLRPAEADVVQDRAREQEALLGDVAHGPAQVGQADLAQIDAVQGDPAPLGIVEAGDQLGHGRLAGPGGPDQGQGRGGAPPGPHVVQNLGPLIVGEADVLKADVAAGVGEGDRVGRLAHRGPLGQHG